MKKYINGYDKFRIRTVNSTFEETVYDFSFKYQALREYYEKTSTLDLFTDGSREKKVHFLSYEFRIFYTDGIEGEDLLKFGRIEEFLVYASTPEGLNELKGLKKEIKNGREVRDQGSVDEGKEDGSPAKVDDKKDGVPGKGSSRGSVQGDRGGDKGA